MGNLVKSCCELLVSTLVHSTIYLADSNEGLKCHEKIPVMVFWNPSFWTTSKRRSFKFSILHFPLNGSCREIYFELFRN
jgi:hypothetical protein